MKELDPNHNMQEMITQASQCRACRFNQAPYNPGKLVWSVGSEKAPVLGLGEAPGEAESLTGIPFVGKAGNCLQHLLIDAGYTLDDIYICNIMKHRPPNNETPTSTERALCAHFLQAQIDIVKPKAIIAFGKSAAFGLSEMISITIPKQGLRGYEFKYKDIPVLCTWHPSYVIRGNTWAGEQLLEDLIYIKELANGSN